MRRIDLNADLGETVDGRPTADDDAMFAVVSSASIACGGHAGDAASMAAAADRAARTGVAIGAHPSYLDRANFGRVVVAIDPATLRVQVADQLAALRAAGADIRYVKPHGALYHAAGSDPGTARAVASAVADLAGELGRAVPILGLGAAIEAEAIAHGLPFRREAFLDRGYRPDGTLVPRGEPGAVLDDPQAAAERAVRLARAGEVIDVDGTIVHVDAHSFCVHGDSPAAVAMARAVRAALDSAGITVEAPW
ncbi:5-oxoprolinase subunit A [Microbacterium sp. 8M]|uniref:5-oxoprolinase subunit PxpA n=1 Tax=Microbacterium sp. 8M TaxID=2653153 RepID=UPI0012F2A998|nr:5-oxoprolinase subunit PxpA [Microbacterium sp. 8M]VXB26276.1 5-oxoprolinase subunit A [Microbacterium sp. 8M]